MQLIALVKKKLDLHDNRIINTHNGEWVSVVSMITCINVTDGNKKKILKKYVYN